MEKTNSKSGCSSRFRNDLDQSPTLCPSCKSFLTNVLAQLPRRPGKLNDHWEVELSHRLNFENDGPNSMTAVPIQNCFLCNLIAAGWRQISWISGSSFPVEEAFPGSTIEVSIGPGAGGTDVKLDDTSKSEWRMLENAWDLRASNGEEWHRGKPTARTIYASRLKLRELRGGQEARSKPDNSGVRMHRFPSNTGSDSTYKHINSWMDYCKESHPRLPKLRSRTPTDEAWLPTRLLDIQSTSGDRQDTVRLVEGASRPSDAEYATLSYCWGRKSFNTLSRKSRKAFAEGIDVDQLPQTFQDAIKVARKLRISYLWIDALCIVQDDQDDWSRESVTMAKIYTYAVVNISAAASDHAGRGIFRPHREAIIEGFLLNRETLEGPIDRQSGTGLSFHCTLEYPDTRDVYHGPLSSRGWVLQERTLSPRVLYFTRYQVFWECKSQRACESHPDGYPAGDFAASGDREGSDPHALTLADCFLGERQNLYYTTPNREIPREEILRLWDNLTKRYSRLVLSHESDKLVALSGIASRLGVSCQLGEYLAGIWRSSLPKSLLWHASEGSTRPLEYRAPSWSWASHLSSRDGVLRPALKVLDTSVTYTGANMGSISSASLQVACQVCQVVFDKSIQGAQYKNGLLYLNPTRGYQRSQSLLQLLLDPDQALEKPDTKADTYLLSVYEMVSNPATLFQVKEHEAAYLLVTSTGAAKAQFRRMGILRLIHLRYISRPSSWNPLMFAFECIESLCHVYSEAKRSFAYHQRRMPYFEIKRALDAGVESMSSSLYDQRKRSAEYVIELI